MLVVSRSVGRSCALFLALVMECGVAMGQSGKGGMRGHLMDATGGTLVGAQIVLQPNGASTVSDAQGQFFFNNLDPGSYKIEISYVGFTTFTKDVTVVAGQMETVDA